MKKIIVFLSILSMLFVLFNCAGTDRDTSELYKKSTTRQAIIERSGTVMKAGTDPERMRTQMMDAENRLQTGGGLFGTKGGIPIFDTDEKKGDAVASIGMPINVYLWRGSLETVNFMPLLSADPFGGVIITDWYTSPDSPDERCKLNIFINGTQLKTTNLKVNSFCQTFSESGRWMDQAVNEENNTMLENAILNKAKKLKLAQS